MNDRPLLEVVDLQTHFFTRAGIVRAVDGVSFQIGPRRTVGLVGESGCGKSVMAQSILQIQQWPGRIVGGSVLLHGESGDGSPARDLVKLAPDSRHLRNVRGREIAYVHQEPMAALSQLHTIGNQLREAVRIHQPKISKAEANRIAGDMLARVGIPAAADRMDEYIFNFSGGMRQRVMIAMALVNRPRLLIADEPTTAVDVTIQRQVLELLRQLQAQMAMSILIITHDLGVIAEIADEVLVMYLGRVVERAPVMSIFDEPMHPYTQALMAARPGWIGNGVRLASIPGSVPGPYERPAGCPFRNRCPHAMPGTCDAAMPALVELNAGHSARCFLHSSQIEEDEA